MLIKSRNFTPKPVESWERDGTGFNPDYVKRQGGSRVFLNSIRYGKNYSLMKGLCGKCDKNTDQDGTNGEHCMLPINEHCQK